MPSAFQQQVYDDSRGTARMGDLVMARGDAVANKELRKGQAAAQTFSTLGEIASGTMRDLVQLKLNEPRRRYEQARMAKAERDERRAGNLEGVLQMAGQLPPEEGISLLRKEGFQKEAGELQKQIGDQRRQAVADQKLQIELAEKNLGQAINLVSGIEMGDPASRQEKYAASVGKIRELVGPDLAGMVPEQYDPQFATSALQWGTQASDRLKMRNEALKLLTGTPEDKRKADEYFTKATSIWLQTVDSQEEWDAALKNASALGASKETLEKFGAAYSPEAVTRAAAFTAKERPPAAAGSFEDFVQTLEARNEGKPLSKDAMLAARREWSGAGRKSAGGAGDLTESQRNTVKRWKATELRVLDKLLRDGDIEQDEYDEKKHALDVDAAEQLGQPPPAPPPDFSGIVASGGTSHALSPATMAELARGGPTGPAPGPAAPPPMTGPAAGRPPAPPMGAAPAAAAPAPARPAPRAPAAALPKVDDVRTMRNGQKVRITRIYPDGTFDAEPVPQ
jgi:hypothetical protein